MDIFKWIYLEQSIRAKLVGKDWQAWNNEQEHAKALVFTNQFGGHYVATTVYAHFKRIVASMGIHERRVYDLRHTNAVMCLQNHDNIKTISVNLGHTSAGFTMNIYAHCTDKMKRESA